MELDTWIQHSMPSGAAPAMERVAMAGEIADVAMRYIEALDAGDSDSAHSELAALRVLCKERIAALRALPKRQEPR